MGRLALNRERVREGLPYIFLYKVFYPCNRCHLATLFENQCVTCDNEVTRVTTNSVFALKIRIKMNEVLLAKP